MNKKQAQAAREGIVEDIDEACDPKKMSKQEALDWLEELGVDIDCRISALREEIKAEG